MIIVGKQNCPRCKKLRALFPLIKYIEIPDFNIGLGDTICDITCFFGITPCKACMIRRHWCNKWFPYKWNLNKISPELVALKQRIILSDIKTYPIIMDDALEHVIPLEALDVHID